jgi:hypothetical protein
MKNMKVGFFVIVFGFLVAFSFLIRENGIVNAAEGTITATNSPTITKWGTITLEPTKQTLTPMPGQSGCPTVAGQLLAGMYESCKQCYGNVDTYATSTPTLTGTQATATSTRTSTATVTPTGTWYGVGKSTNINRTCTYPSSCDFGTVYASTVCPGGKISGTHITSSKNHLWWSADGGSQYWETSSGGNWYVGIIDSAAYNLSKAVYPGQVVDGHGTDHRDWTHFIIYPYNGDGTANITMNMVVCKNYSAPQPTMTPTATAQPCVVNDENVYNLNYGELSGVRYKNDGNEWYWAFSNYDPEVPNSGVLTDTWEKWVRKVMEIKVNVSGVTSVSFDKGTKSNNIIYGAHKISMYDCNDEYLGSYTTSADTGYTSVGWTIPQTSLCRVVIETINDGKQKLFNSKFMTVNGCKQVNCGNAMFSSTYVFDETSKFGLLLGGPTGQVHCQRIFEGINFSPILNRIQAFLDIPTISVITGNLTLPEIYPVPKVDLCIEAITMPRVIVFGYEIPVGMVILAFVLLAVIQLVRKFLFALGGGGNQ